jgi:cytoskeletal protein RodZ
MSTSADRRSSTPVTTTEPADEKPQLELGFAQVAASGLAAISASLAASFLGVAGTIIGAAVGAVIATIGSAIYAHSLKTASARLSHLRPVVVGAGGLRAAQPEPSGGATPAAKRTPALGPWLRGLILVLLGAAVALGGITVAERVLGHPVSNSDSTGTSIARVVSPSDATADEPDKEEQAPETTPTASPSATPTTAPSDSPTAPGAAPTDVPTDLPTDGTQDSTGDDPADGQTPPEGSEPAPLAETAPAPQSSLPAEAPAAS